ncbi:CusA/CzcA family heavy metal efflux RND transporter [Paraflavitalea sp. CAU 1676]|uniref:CusA/CzcA family heavy metal efflux RND transporter n=1 Tax=Paraflavitalea sp. CAU 1676 TaxID=3032598 RepID=UPI0023DB4382|nr:CusA/CzcA family heavy metal efflux RND transporter [Paraflavitalea sp. CAU 1676]MDF2193510.1 CusA/CzcA family heavy metal efflux RND transporter [Paraflavitalea sp. CAU 1676]
MLNRIIGFSVRNKLVIALSTIALIIYGIFELFKLPVDAVPDITNNQVQIITVAPSYGATDIERLVTFPVEQSSSNIAGMAEIRSYSRFGLSLVTLVFDDDVDIYWARQQVSERLAVIQSSIPEGIGKPEMGPISTGLGEIYQYVVKPKKGYENRYDITELRTLQDWIVRRQLLGVKGVAEVSSFGGKLKQYQVAITPAKLQAHGLTIADVFNALENNNENTGGSYIEKQATVLYIRSEGLIGSQDDIGNTVIRNLPNGTPLLIRDVADVTIGSATRYGALTYNNEGEVSGAIVMMLKGANSNVVIKDIKNKIEEIQQSLPEGVVIEPFLDRTNMVSNAIDTVQTNLLEGALIVVFVLVIFLGNLRAGLLVASVIPLSMLFAVIMMNLFGVSGNLMSLGALDFGLIVDGAVIIVEAVMHQLSHSKKFAGLNLLNRQQMDHEVKSASSKMMNSAVFGQIIILIVYLPIFSLQGIEGKMFKPMAQTVAFALLGAFILSLTYIPMMSSLVLSRKLATKANLADRIMARIETLYKRLLTRALQIPRIIVGTVILLFVTSVFILSRLGGEFIPSIEEGDFAVETRVLSGSNLHTTIDHVQQVAGILKSRFPEVKHIVTKIGSSEVPTEPLPMDMGDMIINLKPKKEWTSASSFEELADKMGAAAAEVPGVTTSFQFPVQMRFNELMTGARQDVVCKIFGENLDTLSLYAKQLGNIVKTVEGATELYVEQITGTQQIVIKYNRAALAQYGLQIGDINRNVNAAFAGQSAGQVFEGEKRFELVVRLQQERRTDISDVQNLLIRTPMGTQIPLYQVAKVELVDSPSQIQREDTRRRILVGFNVSGRDVESIVKELQQRVSASIKLPAGYSIGYGGSFENLNEAKARLSVAVPVALILIFLLLYFAFNSIKYGLLIYTAIPLSAIGGIFLLALRGMPFSISAGVGFIALFGIAVLNGIVLVAEFNRIKQQGETDLKRLVLRGTVTRLRPVLMTACVASLGFLPMALSNGAGASVQRPLATVVIGGLLIATLLTLFVLPILYIAFEKGIRVSRKKVATVAALLAITLSSTAQEKIGLKEALDSAVVNNLQVQNRRLRATQAKELIKTATNLPKTSVNVEYGKFNSPYTDNRVSIVQGFSLPGVYNRQKNLLSEEWKAKLVETELQEADIRKITTVIFYELLLIDKKEALLQQMDSSFSAFLRVAALRLKAGETNMLEKASAENQLIQLRILQKQLLQEKATLRQQFMLLLNTPNLRYPQSSSIKAESILTDSSSLKDHPALRWYRQQEKTAEAAIRVEQSKLFPEFSAGYNNLSIRDGIKYGTADRFQSVQLGIELPLFTSAQKAKIRSAQTALSISRNEMEYRSKALQAEYAGALSQVEQYRNIVADFEQGALRNAQDITNTLNKQLQGGEINYLEWTVLNQQSLQTQLSYLEAIMNLNNSIIHLNYLLSK